MFRRIFDVFCLVAGRFALIAAVFLAGACQPSFERIEGSTMGTYYGLVYQGCDIGQQEVDKRLDQLNAAFSTYDQNSEISRFNDGGAGDVFEISDHLALPLGAADRLWQQTQGALDPTVGPLVDLWGFGPTRVSDEPSEAEQDAIGEVVGWPRVTFNDGQLSKQVDGLRLDLSSIAKGYAVDVIADMLEQLGCGNYMVDIGGEIVVSGLNADGRDWRLGIERPDPDSLGTIQIVLEVTDTGVATSGDYRNYRVVDGKRVDHLMDPRTGRPADNQVVSATVLHSEAMYADGYATAAMVMGVDAALALAKEQGFALLVMTRATDDAKVELHYNSLMEKHMVSSQ